MDGTLATTASVAAEAADASDWGLFQSGFIGPLIDFAVVWVAVWLVAIVAARLLSALKLWTREPVTRRSSTLAKVLGGIITAFAAAAFVAVGAMTSLFGGWVALAWIAVAVIGVAGIVVLAFGMATTPWLRITVTGTGGTTNDAWATEVTVRMRELNADNPDGRVERPDGSDLDELVAIADRTDNWAVALVGGAMSMLLNLTPWRLEITVFDTRSGVARLRRNGRVVEDAALQLPAAPADGEHPGELLTLAAAFAAVKVAHEYPDIVGFYNTRNWLGLGLIGIARRTAEAELREQYIARAKDADPRSILIEYEDVYERYRGATDPRRLRELIGRLEPMIELAAEQAGRRISVLDDADFKPWHQLDRADRSGAPEESAKRRGSARTAGAEPPAMPAPGSPGGLPAAAVPDARASKRRRRDRRFHEPEMLKLRLQSFYLMTMRNWLMSGDERLDDPAERRAQLGRATVVVGDLVAALEELKRQRKKTARVAANGIAVTKRPDRRKPDRRKKHGGKEKRHGPYAAQRATFQRMEQRAALGLLLLADELASIDGSMPDAPWRAQLDIAEKWKRRAMASPEIEVKYSVACYQGRRIAGGSSDAEAEFDDLVSRLGEICWVDEYRGLALADPELIPLIDPECSDPRHRNKVRDAVLAGMDDAWQIERFRRARLQLEQAGVRAPSDLVIASVRNRVAHRSELTGDDVDGLADAARILCAALDAECDVIPDKGDEGDVDRERWARLRAARALLDGDRHSVATLMDEYADDRASLVDDVARAMFWVPDAGERAAVELYVERMAEQLRGPHGLPRPDERAA